VAVTPKALNDDELAVVRATEPKALSVLGEDELLDLHARVRRARNKYVGQYRRQGSASVEPAGGRGNARPQNQRARDRAEIFEAALARVSAAVARAARHSAAELKAERLSAARMARTGGYAASATTAAPRATPAKRPPEKSSGRIKKDASSIAAGKRRQARRDAR
jgi:hypothetical protein